MAQSMVPQVKVTATAVPYCHPKGALEIQILLLFGSSTLCFFHL